MVCFKLLYNTKEYLRWYFPEKGSSPLIKYVKKIGLKPGEIILE